MGSLEDSLVRPRPLGAKELGPLGNDKVLMVVEAVEVSSIEVVTSGNDGSFFTSRSDVLDCSRT